MTGYEIVISIVQFLTVLALIGTLVITRGDYKARTRPYIGLSDVVLKDTDNPDEIEFEILARNAGNIPAKNAKLYGRILVTGEKEAPFECETKGSVFPSPNALNYWILLIKEIDKSAILSGSKALQLSMTIDYYGVGREKYQTSSARTYDPSRNSWTKEEGNWV